MLITIDGAVGTGKSTIAKKLAEKLAFIFFDTGAMYRCITYGVILHHINFEDANALRDFLRSFTFDINIYRGEKRYIVEDKDVSDEIRGDAVTKLVSKVSAIPMVREKLVALQREFAVGVNAIFEGRDLGSVVFPNADVKVYLTGRPEVRAKRRFEELRTKFPKETENLTIEKTLEEINQRDLQDSTREHSPLKQPENAFVIDTSDLSVDEIVFKILEHIDTLPSMS